MAVSCSLRRLEAKLRLARLGHRQLQRAAFARWRGYSLLRRRRRAACARALGARAARVALLVLCIWCEAAAAARWRRARGASRLAAWSAAVLLARLVPAWRSVVRRRTAAVRRACLACLASVLHGWRAAAAAAVLRRLGGAATAAVGSFRLLASVLHRWRAEVDFVNWYICT